MAPSKDALSPMPRGEREIREIARAMRSRLEKYTAIVIAETAPPCTPELSHRILESLVPCCKCVPCAGGDLPESISAYFKSICFEL